ncbi:helix-turn-helix protein [Arcicella aurantiaca]|uniref:Helix-turn-helix protein n=1 Tax=Arcicella aurantiaca TaxID=591202 RepID=A0A316DIW3_9BACT|nr:helix-turn-helix domain-containing protein [Arcicella aurantiaca]PWK17179.1 helix-turn-helix protein [Arcicella aurantiaca]
MILYIKNMVCNRCIRDVKDIFHALNIPINQISLGEIEVEQGRLPAQLQSLKESLSNNGFELIEDKKVQIIEIIKTLVIQQIQQENKERNLNFSTLIVEKLNKDYSYLSSLFSSVEGITIEKYILLQKVEKIKELLVYNELSLSEIAFRLDYSSVQHLSTQFKKTTGLNPSYFKKLKDHLRKPLDQV